VALVAGKLLQRGSIPLYFAAIMAAGKCLCQTCHYFVAALTAGKCLRRQILRLIQAAAKYAGFLIFWLFSSLCGCFLRPLNGCFLVVW
jgi:hypothetical protein